MREHVTGDRQHAVVVGQRGEVVGRARAGDGAGECRGASDRPALNRATAVAPIGSPL
ncbi:hypothetical protein G1H11_21360 [Phytoactinopolyspora alkaliphila]|uniref:Uncharacterized protein n=1 Tax=Phytoactinopolyspora alkaliphila TaxID=1783498 RepID=A0A6N9YSC2_9ACTN|nr:hypothetical protein [Phytoactinopolyspora alkaliphila]NED97850.1 hypothetical protein [Phytoactinopolyspora alkaliphila]